MKKRFFACLIPAALLVSACANTDSTPASCEVDKDCPNSTSATYHCEDNVCVRNSSSGNDGNGSGKKSEDEGKFEEVKTGKYCDLAYECQDGSGLTFKCVEKSCVKLVPIEEDDETGANVGKTCETAEDCTDDSGTKYKCEGGKCVKDSSGSSDPGHEETPRSCNISADCNSGYVCENKLCVKNNSSGGGHTTPEEVHYCGDSVVDTSLGEVCDSSNLNSQTCKTLGKGYFAGTLSCARNCLEFDESNCQECDPMDSYSHGCSDGKICKDRHCVAATCGNGTKDEGEICDGTDLGGKTCADLDGYGTGDLKCSSTCFFDTSSCVLSTGEKPCSTNEGCGANQTCESGVCKSTKMECDSTDLVNSGCPDNKVCSNNKCVDPSCGDKIKNQDSEECDGNDFGGKRCADFEGFGGGKLTCSSSCKIDTSACTEESGGDDACHGNDECPSGQICEDSGTCIPDPGAQKVPHLLISQVYTGGGTQGASYKSKYIQILNATGESVNLKGWSIQYASDNGNFTGICTFPEERSFLNNRTLFIELYKGDSGNADIPKPEFSCVDNGSAIKAASTSGIIVLTSNDTKLSTYADLKKGAYVDGVGYGKAVWYEGSEAAKSLNGITELVRVGKGCTDTDDNAADFEARTPQAPNGTLPVSCN